LHEPHITGITGAHQPCLAIVVAALGSRRGLWQQGGDLAMARFGGERRGILAVGRLDIR
jgi:hypothetical protein